MEQFASGFKRNYYGGRSIANELVRQGYIVVVIDKSAQPIVIPMKRLHAPTEGLAKLGASRPFRRILVRAADETIQRER